MKSDPTQQQWLHLYLDLYLEINKNCTWMSRLTSIKITIMELNGYFYCGKHSLLSESFWKMFFPSDPADLSESLHNGNASSVSFHLEDSQCVHGSLLTAGFSSALNTPSTRWQRTLYSMQLLLSLSQSIFSCLFPVFSALLLLCGAFSGPVVNGACVGIWSGSCQLRRTIFHVLSETEVLPCTPHSCFMTVFL